MLVNFTESLQLNKFEKIALFTIFFTLLIAATANIIFVADLFGISITNDTINQVWNYIEGGTGVVSAISWVLGVTIPAWAVAVIGSIGVVSA